MKTLLSVLIAISPCGTIMLAQPVVKQVSNAASESLALTGTQGDWETLPDASIAQGSYFSVYGTGFGVASSTCATNYYNCYWKPYPLPTSLQGTSVSVTVSGTTVSAYIEYAAQSSGGAQINAVLPSNTPVGTGTLTVVYNGASSTSVPITVVPSSFGTFTWTGAGFGPGIFTNAVTYTFITPFTTAKPSTATTTGDYVTIWGTGLGPVPSAAAEQSTAPTPTNLCPGTSCPTVWVGNQPAQVTYAGRSGFTALDQIDFVVPQNVQGCYVPVAIVTGLITSNITTMSVEPNGAPCTDTDGVSMDYLSALLSASGSANIGVIGLSSQYWNIADDNEGDYQQWLDDSVSAQFGTFSSYAFDVIQGLSQVPSVGAAGNCISTPFRGYPPPSDPGFGYVTELDAGAMLGIQSPFSTVAAQSVPQITNSAGAIEGYAGVVGGIAPLPTGNILNFQGWATPFFWLSTTAGQGTFNVSGLSSGTYVVTGTGGKDIGALTASLDVSSAAASFQWTNFGLFETQNGTPPIARDTPLAITWSGGDPQGFIDITLIGSTVTFTVPSNLDSGVQVECIVPSTLGSFNVPTYMLQTLPASANGPLVAGMVLVGPISAPQKISPPPSGLDALYMYYRFLSGYTVAWQ